jgi:hypothetical protein
VRVAPLHPRFVKLGSSELYFNGTPLGKSFSSIGTNSYLLFVFACHTGWRILSVNVAQRRIGQSKCLWQKLTIIHCIRILSAPSHTDDIKSF